MPQTPQSAADGGVDLFEIAGIDPAPKKAAQAHAGDVDLFELGGISIDVPKSKQQGIGGYVADAVTDVFKRAGGAAFSGVAAVPEAAQSGIRSTVRSGAGGDPATVMPGGAFIPGIDTDEAINGPMTQQQRDRRELQAERAAVGVRLPGAETLARAGRDAQKSINDTTSNATQDAVANSQITGNLLKGEIDFGKDPSVRGFLMQGADVFGSMFPVVATALATRSPGAAGAVGGAMAAGEGVENAREFIAKQSHEQLLDTSPLYRRMIDAGAAPDEARRITSAKAEDASALLQGAVATFGDRFTGKLVTGGLDPLLARVAGRSVLGKTAAGAGISALEEGTQELTEGVASDLGTKSVAHGKEIGEDSAANFVLGALGGSAPGAARGVVAGVKDRGAKADAGGRSTVIDVTYKDAEGNTVTDVATTADAAPGDGAAAAPVQDANASAPAAPQTEEQRVQQPDGTPESMDSTTAATRLAELEVIDSTTSLNPVQQEERAALAQRLEQDAAREAELEALGDEPQAVAAEAAAAEQAPAFDPGAVRSKTWPQFVHERGEKVATLRRGTPIWDQLQHEWAAVKTRRAGTNPEGTGAAGTPAQEIQNRDRSRPASVVQMQGMAQNPDYLRLGVSRSPESGAPMVFAVGDQADAVQALGRADVAVMSDGQRVPFRYAVMEAADVQPSNFADGAVNPLFDAAHPGTVKALNNGRTAGLRAAYERGTADAYRQELAADSDMHGIDPAAIAGMQAPVLVRLYSEKDNQVNMGAKSQSQALGLSATEQAATDAALVDGGVLEVFDSGALDSVANRDFARAFIGKLQEQGQDVAGMMDANGALSPAGVTRLQAALVHKAYGDGDLVESLFGSTDNDIRAIGESLKAVAGEWANMRLAAERGAVNAEVDVTENLLQAIRLVQKARRERTALHDAVQQVDMLTGDVPDALTVGMLRLLYSGHYLTRPVGRDRLVESLRAYMGAALATSASGDMFGEQVGPAAILAALSGQPVPQRQQTNDTSTDAQQAPAPQGGREPPDSDAAGERADAAGPEARRQEPDGAGRAAAGDRASRTGQEADAAGDAVAPELELSSYTPDEIQAQQAQQQEAEQRRARDDVQAEAQARAESERKEVAEHFQLGQDAKDALSGQQGVFDKPAADSPARPETAAAPAAPAASQRPKLRDTRGTGVRLHGTSRPLPEGGPTNDGVYRGNVLNIYGQGFYTTDAADIAAGYTRKGQGGEPTLYEIAEHSPVRLYDMNAPMEPEVQSMAKRVLDDLARDENTETGERITTLAQLFDEARAESRYEGVSADELQERFDGIRYNLEDMGYRGFAHVGGGKTGNQAHKVNIYWYPEDDLSVTRSELSRFEEGAEQLAGVPFKRAESSVAPTMTADLAQELLRIAGGAAPAGARRAPQAPMARVQKVVDEVRQAWANAPRINVVFDLQDPHVPQEARDADQLQAAEGAEGVPKGFYFDGEVYLVASQLATPEEAARVLYHEALGHHGLRGAFGEKLDAVLDQIIAARPREVRAKLKEYGELDDMVGRRYAAEEVLAEMAETQPQLGFVRRAVAAIRAWLRAHVPALRELAVTDAEIIRDFILPARRWVERGAVAAASVRAAKPAFSLDSGAGRRALQELSELDDLFTFPKSKQTDLRAIAKEHAPDIEVSKPVSIAGRQEYTLKMPDGKKATLSVRQPNPYGEQVYDMLYTAEGMEAVAGRPGENPEDVPPTTDVWLDVSKLSRGDSGAMAYSIASTFAHNTDSIFIGDPHGLSKTALRRRLEQMLSSALKFGTTRHLAPHPDQVRGGHGVPGLRWVYGDDVGNVERMIVATLEGMDNAFPTSRLIEYDADHGTFRRASTGDQLSRQRLADVVGRSLRASRGMDRSGPAEAEAGWRTVARAAVWRALLREAGGRDQGDRRERGSLLGEFAERHAQVLTDRSAKRRVFYSRGPASSTASPAQSKGLLGRMQDKVADLTGYRSVDDFLYSWQDKFIDLKRIQEHIKALNGTVSETNDAYRGEELYHKRVAKRAGNFLRDEVRPLLKRMNEAKVAIEALERFLHARHAPEANRVMAERNPGAQQLQAQRDAAAKTVEDLRRQLQRAQARGMATGPVQKALGQALIDQDRWNGAEAFAGAEEERLSLSGMSDAEAKAIMDGYSPEQRQVLDELAARVDRINDGTLKTLGSYGLMDQATLSAWRKTYQHYVPLHRDEAHPDSKAHPIGQGFSTKGDASKRRTGSNERVTNILSHIVMQREAALTRGEKNNVVKRMYLLAAQNPDKELWSLELPKKKALDPDTGLVKTMVDQGAKARDNVVTVRIGGKDRYIVFNERNEKAVRLAVAMKNLDAMELDRFTRIAAWITRWFSSVNTQYNPVFGVMNLARDLQGAMLQLSTTPLAGKQAEVFRNIRRNTRAIYKELRRERREEGAPTGQWAQLWEQLQLDGGTTGYRDLYADPKDRAKALQKALDQAGQGSSVAAGGRALLGWLSDFNETLEATTRLGVYKAALDQGISRQEAASIAKNITVNFNRKGRNLPVAGAHFAFLNAAIQGNKRMVETLTGPAGRNVMMGGVALGMVSAMAGYLMMGGGDGADDEWKKIPEFVKERAIIIPLGRQDYVAIPLPLGFHVFPNIGRTIVEMAVHDDPTKSRMGHVLDMAVLALDAYNPLGGSADLGQMASPTWFDPALALARNKDWTGREIYREDRNSNDPTPGASRVKDSTATPYRWLATFANAVTGGNEWRPGAASPTPEAIEYLVEQITGGVGREVNKAVAMATSAFTGEELAPHQVVLAGRLYGNTRGANGQSNAYYENLKRINISESEFKARVQRGEDADAVLADVPLARAHDAAKALDKKISDLRKFRRSVQASDAPNKRDQVKAINQEIEVSMHLLNQEVHITLGTTETHRP
ncbi:LPD38 domain-containing protein [Delftia acidovorans]|uniref:LPD38 domain-containing protein n=1 Tax=Delftia acidovorans TaxID=80866 RepID=UPI00333EADD0